MKVFGVESGGRFTEFVQEPFRAEHDEKDLERWLEANADAILEDEQLLIIGRQVRTDLGKFIDLLGVDRDGNAVVVELKRNRTPRDVVAQALEYAAYVQQLDADGLASEYKAYVDRLRRDGNALKRIYSDRCPSREGISLSEHHREYFELEDNEAVAFNKDLRIVIVGQRVTPEVRRSVTFLGSKGIRVSCHEFTFFKTDKNRRLLTQEIVVGEFKKPGRSTVTQDEFLKSCDPQGRLFFERLLKRAKKAPIVVNWGARGFSFNVDVNGARVHLCYAWPGGYVVVSRRMMERKAAVPGDKLDVLWENAVKSGFFRRGRVVTNLVSRNGLDKKQTSQVFDWFLEATEAIKKHGVRQTG